MMKHQYRDQDYLIHYGVQGMQWGVRKDRKSSGSVRRKNFSASKVTKTIKYIPKAVKKKYDSIDSAKKQKIKKVVKTTAITAGAITLGLWANSATFGISLHSLYNTLNGGTMEFKNVPYNDYMLYKQIKEGSTYVPGLGIHKRLK